MEPLKPDLLTVTSSELLSLLAKHFGVRAQDYLLKTNYRFATGTFGPAGDAHPGIVMGMHSISLAPIKQARKRAVKKAPAEKP